MPYHYHKIFKLKDVHWYKNINLILYTKDIRSAEKKYNSICARTRNRKNITITISSDHLDFHIISQKPLKPKYIGVALKLFSQILVQNSNFYSFCTNTNPKKLFVTA